MTQKIFIPWDLDPYESGIKKQTICTVYDKESGTFPCEVNPSSLINKKIISVEEHRDDNSKSKYFVFTISD